MGQLTLHTRQDIHFFPVGFLLTIAIVVWAFITSDTGHAILQKALFFLNLNANKIAVR